VYENSDIVGVEIAGVLKNIIAIASGALSGLGFGDNAKGLLISRGAVEMVYLGRALGGDTKSFLGVAGIGDLVTTCNSPMSRNFTVGYRLAKGEKLEQIVADMQEVADRVIECGWIALIMDAAVPGALAVVERRTHLASRAKLRSRITTFTSSLFGPGCYCSFLTRILLLAWCRSCRSASRSTLASALINSSLCRSFPLFFLDDASSTA